MNKGRFNPKQISSEERMKLLDLLWTSIAELKTRDEVKNFFKDLLSESEAIMLARRILIAKKLLEGNDYFKIIKELKVGKSTIASVHRWLISGFGGYEKALKNFDKTIKERVERIEKAEENDRKIAKEFGTFAAIRHKYPMHFMLLNLLLDKKKKS